MSNYYYDFGKIEKGSRPFSECRYDGDLIEKGGYNILNGFGELTCPDGMKIKGLFENDNLIYAERWTYPKGDIYSGEVKD